MAIQDVQELLNEKNEFSNVGSVEIFETSDVESLKLDVQTSNELSDDPSEEYNSFDESIDQSRLPSISDQSKKLASAGIISGAWADLSDAISNISRKGYTTFYSSSGIESYSEKLNRLLREAQELVDHNKECKKEQSQNIDKLERLLDDASSSYSDLDLKLKLKKILSRRLDTKDIKSATQADYIEPFSKEEIKCKHDLLEFEKRISAIEQTLVTGVGGCDINMSSASKALKHKLYELTDFFSALAEPERAQQQTKANIEALKKTVLNYYNSKDLEKQTKHFSEFDREKEYERVKEMALHLSLIYKDFDRILELEPLVKLMVERFKHLEIIHKDATEQSNLLSNLQKSQETIKEQLKQWNDVLSKIENRLDGSA